MKNDISVLYEEIYRKRIDSLNDKQDIGNLHQIKYDIEDAYAKGKVSELLVLTDWSRIVINM